MNFVIGWLTGHLRKALRLSGEYFKTDMFYLAKGGFWISLGNVIFSISGFLLAIAFANLLPKETFGTYQYILSMAALLAIPTLAGIDTAITKSVAQGKESSFLQGLYTKMYWGVLGGAASLATAAYYYFHNDNTLTIAFLITALFLPFMDSLGIYGAYLQGKQEFKMTTICGGVVQVSRALILGCILFFIPNLLLLILAYFISTTVLRFFAFLYTYKRFKPNHEHDPHVISYGMHLSVMNVFGLITEQIDKVILWHLLGPAALATYSFALAPVARLQVLLRSLESLALPKFAKGNMDTLKETLPPKLRTFFFLLLVPTGLYILLAPYVFHFIFPQYIEAIFYSQVYAIMLLFIPQKLMGAALTAHGRKKELYYLSIVGPVIKIGALLALVPFYGILGAIIALLIPYAVNSVLLFYFFNRN